ncbi:MAG: hypothetical protein Q8K59_05055 [Nitrosomonas sp.]|nr:hypothetical protein [Nitrosomonas sp.]MDP1950453.1 hypothetical protein [Nitrosomonas sp.]
MKVVAPSLVVLIAVGLSGCIDTGRYEIDSSGDRGEVFRLDKQTGEICRFSSTYENSGFVFKKRACDK